MNPRVVRWFTPGLHVKRWLVLLMVGMVLISLGIGYALANVYRSGVRLPPIFYYLTLQFVGRYVRGSLFAALGLSIILFALYKLTQSVLGPLRPAPCRVPDLAAGRLPAVHHGAGRRRAAHDHPLPAPLQGGQPERALVRESLHHGHGRDHRRLRARDPGVRTGPGRPRADRA